MKYRILRGSIVDKCVFLCACARACVLPEPVYVSSTVSPVVVAVSLLFIGSVFTAEHEERYV